MNKDLKIIDVQSDPNVSAFGNDMAFGEPFLRCGDFSWPYHGGDVFLKGEMFQDEKGMYWTIEFGFTTKSGEDVWGQDHTDPRHWDFYNEDYSEELSFEEFMERFME